MKRHKKTLKELKNEYYNALDNNDYELLLNVSNEIISNFPKNVLGYEGIIKASTNNYQKYLNEKSIKNIKKYFEKYLQLIKKQSQKKVTEDFNEYVNDCKEVENLSKIKKELTSKCFLNILYYEGISFINQNINTFNIYNIKGKKIVNIYNFINGLFYLFFMIFNLIFKNYLLIFTIPFGICGIITIYSFLNVNFIKKDNVFLKTPSNKKLLDQARSKIAELKSKIERLDEEITFYKDQKVVTISRIPSSFSCYIDFLIDDDEEKIATDILNALKNDNMSLFTYLINEKTDLNADDVINKSSLYIKEEDVLSKFVKSRLKEIKNGQKKSILMKEVKKVNYIIMILLLTISVLSFIVLIKNVYEVNLTSFVLGIITGFISMLTYNINTGKSNSLSDTFGDNLLSVVFNSSLMYNLVYFSITKSMSFTYAIIEIPIIFTLILIGFVMLVSIIKYNYFLKKLRETKKT